MRKSDEPGSAPKSTGLVAALRRWYELKGWPHLRDAADELERLSRERDELAAVVREMVGVLATERRTEFRQRWLERARAALKGRE